MRVKFDLQANFDVEVGAQPDAWFDAVQDVVEAFCSELLVDDVVLEETLVSNQVVKLPL